MSSGTVIVIIILILLLILVIGIIIYVYKNESEDLLTNKHSETCNHCKYLVEYNDGHVECWLKIEKACIDKSLGLRYFKEKKENNDGRENNSNFK